MKKIIDAVVDNKNGTVLITTKMGEFEHIGVCEELNLLGGVTIIVDRNKNGDVVALEVMVC